MTTVYLLWHISHALRDTGQSLHQAEDGTPLCDEQAGDDVKLLGVYSTPERTQARLTEARQLPGFCHEFDCFQVSAYIIDRDEWREGFIGS